MPQIHSKKGLLELILEVSLELVGVAGLRASLVTIRTNLNGGYHKLKRRMASVVLPKTSPNRSSSRRT